MRHEAYELAQYQSLPLDAKVRMTKQRIKAWYEYWDGHVYVSFSGGKDSTVLLHLVRSMYPDVPAVFSDTGLEYPEYPDVPAVFSDTGLEYPEIRKFAMSQPNVVTVRPKMIFSEVIKTYGYPVISKEVAEAIYYARRIRGGQDWRKKETGTPQPERKRREFAQVKHELIKTSTARNRRTVLLGKLRSEEDSLQGETSTPEG